MKNKQTGSVLASSLSISALATVAIIFNIATENLKEVNEKVSPEPYTARTLSDKFTAGGNGIFEAYIPGKDEEGEGYYIIATEPGETKIIEFPKTSEISENSFSGLMI